MHENIISLVGHDLLEGQHQFLLVLLPQQLAHSLGHVNSSSGWDKWFSEQRCPSSRWGREEEVRSLAVWSRFRCLEICLYLVLAGQLETNDSTSLCLNFASVKWG